jgi:hypothetical protein
MIDAACYTQAYLRGNYLPSASTALNFSISRGTKSFRYSGVSSFAGVT